MRTRLQGKGRLQTLIPSGHWLLAGLLAAVIAAVAAVGLVGTAGWLITASGLAGLAGTTAALEIFAPGALIRLFALTRTVGRYLERLLVHDAVFRLIARLRHRLFLDWGRRAFATLEHLRDGVLFSRFLVDVERLESIHAGLILPLAATLVTTGLFLLAVFLFAGPMSALVVGGGLLLILGTLTQWWVQSSRAEARLAIARNRFSARVSELLAAYRELTFSDPRGHLNEQIRQAGNRIDQRAEREAARAARRDEWVQVLFGLLITTLLGLAALPSIRPLMPEIPWLAMVLLGLVAMAGLYPGLATAFRRWGGIRVALHRLAPEASEGPSVITIPPDPEPPSPEWILRHVTLRRGVTDRPVFLGLNLTIPAGKQITITGPSGCGKSRLAALLCGLAEPDAGAVLLGGNAVGDWPEASRFATVGLLEQRNALIEGTMHDNVAMGRTEMPVSECRHLLGAMALTDAGLNPEQWIGEETRPLSGGEARRVCLLRVVAAKTPAVILDEPFRGLDARTRTQVVAWLRGALAGCTVILLDHRPCPGFAEDALYRIEDGRLARKAIPDKP